MSTKPLIVSAGYMPLDVVLTPTQTSHHAGGTGANVAAILAFLGWQSVVAGQTGTDLAGQRLIDDLNHAGVSTDQVHRPSGMATPRLVHSVAAGGHAFAYTCPSCHRKFPRSRPLTLEQAEQCIAVYPTPTVYFFDRANAATLYLAERYASAGTLVMFEPSVPANAESLRRAATVSHIIKHSDDRSIGGLNDIGVTPRENQVRIVTHGTDGLEYRVGAQPPCRLAALPTLTVDSGGAGDWTTAGMLRIVAHEKLRPSSIARGLRYGQALAALSCTVPGARGLAQLTQRTVDRRAKRALIEGKVTSPVRVKPSGTQPIGAGNCPTCLLPLAEAVEPSLPMVHAR